MARELVLDLDSEEEEIDNKTKGQAKLEVCRIRISLNDTVKFERHIEECQGYTRRELDSKITDMLKSDNVFWVKSLWHTDDFGEGEGDLIYNPIYALADSSAI